MREYGTKIRSRVEAGKFFCRWSLSRILDPHPKVFILVYHRVLPDVNFNPYGTKISEKVFEKQIKYLKTYFPIISLDDFIQQYRKGKFDASIQVIITFDDGYQDNYYYAFPILKAFDIKATFFLVTDYIETRRPLWDYELAQILSAPSTCLVDTLNLPHLGKFNRRVCEPALKWLAVLNDAFKHLTDVQRKEVLSALYRQLKVDPFPIHVYDQCFTWDQVKEIQNAGMEIGAHTCSHPSLARIPIQAAIQEIEQSKMMIESKLNYSCYSFAFPFGSVRDFNDTLIHLVEKIGFECCVLNVQGYNRITISRWRLFRNVVTEFTNLRYLIG
jgi:peptidoglycan/xylan/chitin deacetylase (PgdA/CDA1 family)